MTLGQSAITLYDLQPSTESYRDEVIDGLSQSPKRLPSKLFYDERGSELFEKICRLDEYYLTRTELSIMDDHAAAMAGCIGSGAILIELGSGASVKTRILLDHLDAPAAYVPVDISRDHLEQSAATIYDDYPGLSVAAVCADFTARVDLPDELCPNARRVVYFPGSTIGNFQPREAVELLRNIRCLCGSQGGLLIGIDRKKDVGMLEVAYNDAQSVTAKFNLNMLTRINRELDANFDERLFRHRAHYNAEHGRIEMHLISSQPQVVNIDGHRIPFREGESICTEYSYKFSLDDFQQLALQAGLSVVQSWSDDDELFSVLYLKAMA